MDMIYILKNMQLVSMCLFGSAFQKHFQKNLKFFFFYFEVICFWYFQIILMCWSQKWFLKNKKILLAHFFEWKTLWKTTITTFPYTIYHILGRYVWRRAFCHSLKYIFQIQEFCGEECFVWIWEFTCGDISQVYICMLVYVCMYKDVYYMYLYTHIMPYFLLGDTYATSL